MYRGLKERMNRFFLVHQPLREIIFKELKCPEKKLFMSRYWKWRLPFKSQEQVLFRCPKQDAALSWVSRYWFIIEGPITPETAHFCVRSEVHLTHIFACICCDIFLSLCLLLRSLFEVSFLPWVFMYILLHWGAFLCIYMHLCEFVHLQCRKKGSLLYFLHSNSVNYEITVFFFFFTISMLFDCSQKYIPLHLVWMGPKDSGLIKDQTDRKVKLLLKRVWDPSPPLFGSSTGFHYVWVRQLSSLPNWADPGIDLHSTITLILASWLKWVTQPVRTGLESFDHHS